MNIANVNAVKVASKLNWTGWWTGIWSALITAGSGAFSGALGTMLVDPTDFNLETGLAKVLKVMAFCFLIPGLQSMFKFLQSHPVPEVIPTQTHDGGTQP